MDYYSLFCGPDAISMVNEPRVRLRVGHQHSQFWPILARFMDYCSLSWVHERFPRLTNPEVRLCVVMNNPSIFDFGLFHDVLLTILES